MYIYRLLLDRGLNPIFFYKSVSICSCVIDSYTKNKLNDKFPYLQPTKSCIRNIMFEIKSFTSSSACISIPILEESKTKTLGYINECALDFNESRTACEIRCCALLRMRTATLIVNFTEPRKTIFAVY